MYCCFLLEGARAKSLRECTKHERSLVSVSVEIPSLNYPMHFLTVFLDTKALLTVLSINTELLCCIKDLTQSATKGSPNVFSWSCHSKCFRHTNFRKTFLQLLHHLWHLPDSISWCTIVYSLVLTSTKEVNAVLIGTFVVQSLKIISSTLLIFE